MGLKTLNWNLWLKRGDQYLRAVQPKGEKSKFNNEILYNLLSMSFESYAMAILDFHGTLPENHTYTDLIEALDKVILLDPEVKKRILKYEGIQSICSVDRYQRKTATTDELSELEGAIKKIREIAHDVCSHDVII